jgi:hypothetical protein
MLRRVIPGLLVGAIVLPNPVLLHPRAFAAPQPRKRAPQLAPLRTGSTSAASRLPVWRKEEAEPWRGEGWLGWKAGGETLEPVELIVRDAPAAIANYPELTVEAVPQIDFAVRCVPGLRAGRIHSVITNQVDLKHDGPLSIVLANQRYTIRVQSAREDLSDARVVLARGTRSQVLYSTGGFADEPHFDVAWAGDLDQDGRLDLVVNLNRKYSWHPYRLLLSSRASASQLVGEAAVFAIGD